MKMSMILWFVMEDCLSLPSLGWKLFNSMKLKHDEPLYTYTDKYLRHFGRPSTKVAKHTLSTNIIKPQTQMIFLKLLKKKDLCINGNFPIFDIFEIDLKYIKEYEDRWKKWIWK